MDNSLNTGLQQQGAGWGGVQQGQGAAVSPADAAKQAQQTTGACIVDTQAACTKPPPASQNTYANAINMPGLPPGPPSDLEAGNAAISKLFNFQSPTLMAQVFSNIGTPTPPGSAADQILKDLANSNPELADEIQTLADEQGISPAKLAEVLKGNANFSLQQQLNNITPASDAAKLKALLFMPGSTTQLTPELKAQLEKILGNVFAEAGADTPGASEELIEAMLDEEAFTNQVSDDLDQGFSDAIKENMENLNLSDDDVTQLTWKSRLPDEVTLSPDLQKVFEDLNDQVSEQLQNKYGFDSGSPPVPDKVFNTALLNGVFLKALEQSMKQQGLDPNHPDINKYIAMFIANASNPAIPANVKKLLESLNVTGILTEMIEECGLSPNWKPGVKGVVPPGINPEMLAQAKGGMGNMKEMVDGMKEMVSKMPDGPEKQTYFAYLMAVGLQIDKLQQAIYAMQSSQSNTNKMLSRCKLCMEIDNLARQNAEAAYQKEQMDKESKMQKVLGPIMPFLDIVGKIFTAVVALVLCAFFPELAPLIIAATVMFLAKPDLMQKAMGLAQQLFEKMGIPPQEASIMGLVVDICAAPLLCGCNPMIAIQQFFGQGGAMDNVLTAFGVPPEQKAIAMAVLNGVAQIGMMVAMMAFSGGLALPAILGDAVIATADALNVSVKTLETLAKIVMIGFGIAVMAMQATKSGVQMEIDLLQANVVLSKARAEEYAEQVEAIIAMLKQLIDKLLSLMNGNTDFLSVLSDFQSSKWNDAETITTQAWQSLQG